MLSRKWRHPRTPPRRGAVLVIVASMLVVLIGVAALSIDAGHLYQMRRKTQVAADAAADAAAIELYTKFAKNHGVDSDGKAHATALSMAAAHGYGTSGSNSTVTVNIPPLSGPHASQKGYVETIITSTTPPRFSAIFGCAPLSVTSRAVAAGTMIPTQASVLVLDPKRKNSLKLKGKNTTIEVSGDIIVNSNNKKAVKVDKKAQVKAEHVLVTGGIDRKSKRNIDAEVSTGVAPTPDPWSSLPPPPKGTNRKVGDYKTTSGGADHYNLQPGTYNELKFDKNDVVRMAPGNYYVDGGRVEFKGSASLEAYGVMIYNCGKKGMTFKTTGNLTMTPRTSGTYAGISLFQDRATKTKVQFKKAEINIRGVVYAPNSEVKFNHTDADFGGDSDDDDDDLEDEEFAPEDDSGSLTEGSIGASFVSRKLTIDKHSRVRILGADISAMRPLMGVVE